MRSVERIIANLANCAQLFLVVRREVYARWRQQLQGLEVAFGPDVAGTERRHHSGSHVT